MNAFLAVDAFINIFLEMKAFSDNFTIIFLLIILDVLYFTATFLIKMFFFLKLVFFSCKTEELEINNKDNEILSLKDKMKSSSNKVEEDWWDNKLFNKLFKDRESDRLVKDNI